MRAIAPDYSGTFESISAAQADGVLPAMLARHDRC